MIKPMTAKPEIELELTYLAKQIPAEIKGINPQSMVDIYVPEDLSVYHPSLRIRKRGDKLEITKKQPLKEDDASVQAEQTISLNEEEFAALESASQRKVVKDRYLVKVGGRTAEVDVFKEALEGLILIDFEFDSQDNKESFSPPSCCLVDVTQEQFIAGGLLAGKSYADIKPQLESLGYKALTL